MTMWRYLVGVGVIVSLGGAGVAQTAPQPTPVPAPAARASMLPTTQALLDSYIAQDKLPGIVTAVGYGDFATIYLTAGTIGDEAGAPKADADTLWRVYSMTKPITGIAAMILIERGKLKLDQPIADFIPAFRQMRVQLRPDTLESRLATTPITVRHLLTHSAGLGYTIVTKGPLRAEYNRLGLTPATVNTAAERELRRARPATLAAFAERVAQLPLIAEPGTVWSYSISLDVLGAVIEKASGMPFDAFVQSAIFDPLGMKSSFWTVPRADVSRLSSNAMFLGDNRVPIDPGATSVWLDPPSFPYGGAGLVMSARDYDRFLHMLQNYGQVGGVRVLKEETARLALSNLLPAGVAYPGGGGFGAGGSVVLADTPGGAGKGTYGWGGAAGTIAFVDPVNKLRGTVMVNYMPAERYKLRTEVLDALKADMARLHQ